MKELVAYPSHCAAHGLSVCKLRLFSFHTITSVLIFRLFTLSHHQVCVKLRLFILSHHYVCVKLRLFHSHTIKSVLS